MRATVKKKRSRAASHTSPQKLQKRVNQIWGGETVEQRLWMQPVFDDAIMRPLTRWRGSHRVVAVFKSLFFIMENRRAALRDVKDLTWRKQKTNTFIDLQKMASFVVLCTAHCKAFFICGVFHWQAKDAYYYYETLFQSFWTVQVFWAKPSYASSPLFSLCLMCHIFSCILCIDLFYLFLQTSGALWGRCWHNYGTSEKCEGLREVPPQFAAPDLPVWLLRVLGERHHPWATWLFLL